MKKSLFVIALILLAYTSESFGQIGFAVAKDDDHSALRWQLIWNTKYPDIKARNKLKDLGYENVYTLPGGKECGHNLTGGYWVVVEAYHELYNGKWKTSFGAGASKTSYNEAESRAVINLRTYDWSWERKDGYQISKKGTF